VSVAIRQLEQALGTDLLLRTTREVSLTDAGRTFLEGARRTLTELDRSVRDARRAADGTLGSLRVAFAWSARFETLPAIGHAFRATHPDVELLTEEMWNARMLPELRAGTIDLAVSLCPEIAGDLAYETVRSEEVVALLAATHPHARAESLSLGELADEGLLLFPRELAPRLHDVMVGLCRDAGFEPTVRSESFHTGWELQVLSDLKVVALAPASVVRQLPGGVVAVPLDDASAGLETAIVWRRDDLSPAGAAFRDVARGLFE
jgi:DNA-binding transcriptional LysR family regulator